MLNIFVIGYYDRFNIGDDLLGYAIYKFLKQNINSVKITIKNIDDIYQIPKETDVVIFGGGDVFNNYFLDKLINLNNAFHKKVPIYAISTGLPYKKIGDTGKLDLFDFFYMRTVRDVDIVSERINSNYAKFIPDLVFYLDYKIEIKNLEERKKNYKKTIGVCLARTIYNNNIFYSKIIKKIALILNEITEYGHKVILIPFCTGKNPEENDMLLNRDIKDMLLNNPNVILHEEFSDDKIKNIKEMFNVFNKLDLVICSRFHAHIMSILHNIPFISLIHTSKVNDLLDTYGLDCLSSKCFVDNKNQVTDIDELEIVKLFIELNHEKKYNCVYNKIEEINRQNKELFEEITLELVDILSNKKERNQGPRYLPIDIINKKITNTKKFLLTILEDELKINIDHQDILNLDKGNIYYLVSKYGLEENNNIRKLFSQAICYSCTEEYKSIYFYGLNDQIFNKNFNLNSSIEWILRNYYQNYYYDINYFVGDIPKINKVFNLEYIKQDHLKGYHRSGWSYVAYHLGVFNSPDGVWLDMYVDTTFNPANKIYEYTKLIPYRNEWCGFVHHTFDTSYSPNNLTIIFENKLFLESLETCKGLFTLSEYLKIQVEEKLKELNLNILVCNLVHPTEIPEIPELAFNLDEYKKNNKIVQIGGWLRNSYGIYELECKTNKYVLKGKDMNVYFKPENFNITKYTNIIHDIYLGKEEIQENKHEENELICRDLYNHKDILKSNKYISGLINYLKKLEYQEVFEQRNNKLCFTDKILDILEEKENKVNIINTLNNEEYDKLLSNHIVFLNLIDASAVNTLIECVVRNTPILINKLPAIVEILGDDYPFYYDNMQEASEKVDNIKLIENTYKYMNLYLDKNNFKIEKFILDIENSCIYKCINTGNCENKNTFCGCF
jgi:polysaccharide pyruvyl transferase WcaK-like protein